MQGRRAALHGTITTSRGGNVDFDAAVVAHSRWKDRIRGNIHSGERLDASPIGRDDNCDLGRWIHAATPEERALPEFEAVKTAHAHFHTVAAETVREVSRLPTPDAEARLAGGTPYGLASAACVRAIVALRDRLSKPKG